RPARPASHLCQTASCVATADGRRVVRVAPDAVGLLLATPLLCGAPAVSVADVRGIRRLSRWCRCCRRAVGEELGRGDKEEERHGCAEHDIQLPCPLVLRLEGNRCSRWGGFRGCSSSVHRTTISYS